MTERVFCRGIASEKYGLKDELQRLRDLPRVIKFGDIPWKGGPQAWNKYVLDPSHGGIQSLMSHIHELSPGGRSVKHGHQNEALFYILEGKGYDIHDGVRYDWEAGDVVVVHAGCVHQHFNADPHKPTRAVVIKPKPMYMFLNMIYQGTVIPKPKEPLPGWERYHPEETY